MVSLRSDCARPDCDSLSRHFPNSTRLESTVLESTLLLIMNTRVRQFSVDDKLRLQSLHHIKKTKYTFLFRGRFEPLILVFQCRRARSPDTYLEPCIGQM